MPNTAQFDKQLPPYLMPTGKPNEQVFFKVDSTTHTVYGLATSEAVDADGEICDYDTAKAEITKWSTRAETVTTAAGQQPSKGNIRLQHDRQVIAGKVLDIDCRDAAKQIWIKTKPANDEIWNLCEGGFVTGFSISGSYLWKKKEGDFTRFGPSFVEISYVDLPCNPEAVFEYVKADGSTELRKFQKKGSPMATTPAAQPNGQMPLLSDEQLATLAQKTADIVIEKTQAQSVNKDKKTKRVAGEDLEASAFAYVGDATDTSTWKLPLHFSTDEKSARHVRNALARFGQTKGIPDEEKDKVKAKIEAAAKKYGVEVSDDSEKVHKAILFCCEPMFTESARAAIVKSAFAKGKDGMTKQSAELMAQGFVISNVSMAEDALTKSVFAKSLWDVHNIADVLQTLTWCQQCLHSEREYEGDESSVPDDLKSVIQDLSEVFLSLAEEEVGELLETLKVSKSAATRGQEGVTMPQLAGKELEKAHSVATKITKAKEAVTAHYKMHGSPMDGMHKAHHDGMHGHFDAAMGAMKAAMDSGDLKKAMPAAHHIMKAKEMMSDYHDKAMKMHKAHHDDMMDHIDGIHKAIGTDQDIAGDVTGPGADSGMKSISAEDLKKAMGEVIAPLQTALADLKKTNETLATANTELAKKVTELENRPAPDLVRSVELPKGVVSIARESVLKSNTISATSDELGELALG